MKIINCTQGSPEWYLARLGKFTSSNVHKLLTNSRKKDEVFGDTAMSYIYEVAAGRALSPIFKEGENFELYLQRVDSTSKAMRYGSDMESYARDFYRRQGYSIKEVGFIEYNDYFGDSPDGIIEDENIPIEIKCPSPASHRKYCQIKDGNNLLEVNKDYYVQCQCHMIAADSSRCEFISYDPMQIKKMHVVCIKRDEDMIAEILNRLELANQVVEKINSDLIL